MLNVLYLMIIVSVFLAVFLHIDYFTYMDKGSSHIVRNRLVESHSSHPNLSDE
jgi:hypothetical protein